MHPQHNQLNIEHLYFFQTTDKNKRWHDVCSRRTPAGTRLDLLLSLISTPDWILWLKRVWFNLYILSVSHHPGCDSHATSRWRLLTHLPSPRRLLLITLTSQRRGSLTRFDKINKTISYVFESLTSGYQDNVILKPWLNCNFPALGN